MHPPAATRVVTALRILLVEDHFETGCALSRLLTHFGYQVTVEHSVQSALEQLGANNFDVILSDIGLPDGSGYDLISRAKQQQVVKGVAITALGTTKDIQRSKEAGFDFHLTKPFDVYELRTLLDKFRAGP
jgi:CheY-like chemotaxis protein